MKQILEAKEFTFMKKVLGNGRLWLEFSKARAVIAIRVRAEHDFAERVCIGHLSLLRTQASRYRDRLHVVLCDGQLCGECFNGYRVCVDEEKHYLYLGDANGLEKQRGHSTPPEGDGVVLEVPLPRRASCVSPLSRHIFALLADKAVRFRFLVIIFIPIKLCRIVASLLS